MRAFAGVTHNTVRTKTVTRLCVYVDRKDGGDSYGDLSAQSKYGHKTCIVGKRGPAGNTSVITWNKTVAVGATIYTGKRKAGGLPAGAIVLATVGPFTVRGYCNAIEGTSAVTDVVSGQDGSSFAWGDNYLSGDFNSGNDQQASNSANGSSNSPDFVNEYSGGDFSVSTGDQKTAFTGFANNGVYIDGPNGPACSFTGYLVMEK
ncbi:MAG TPA: hypothetical protein VMU72_08600 [Gaiellaceae bacterium]|nr:hypothetical protein [Gaiellaceae bacterium]